MTQLTLEAARALLGDAYGITKTEPLTSCRVNFFEPGFLAMPPGIVAMVRQDMLGRRHTHRFLVEDLRDFAVVSSRRRQTALQFAVGGVVWQVDGLAEEVFDSVIRHLSQSSEGIATDEEVEKAEDLAEELMEEVEEVLELEPEPEEDAPGPRGPDRAPARSPSGPLGAGASNREVAAPQAEARPRRRPTVTGEPRRTPVDDLLGFLDEAVIADPSADGLALLLHKLFVQCLALEQTDRALLVAQSLFALGRANPTEKQLVARYQTPRVLEAEGALTAAHWEALAELTPADRALEAVTAALAPALVRMTARSPRDFGLKGQPEGVSNLLFGRVFGYVQRVCSLPELHYHPLPEGPKGIAFANLAQEGVWAPALVVGADFLSGRTETQLAFRIGHELTFLRREHLIRVLLPSLAQQAVFVLTAVALAVPDRPIPGEEEGVIRAQRSLLTKYMEIEDFEGLSVAVRRLLGQTEPFDLTRWNRAVECAALRVGMLLSGDVQAAVQVAAENIGSVQEVNRARGEVIRFAVGNLHQQLRAALRLAVA